MFTASMQIPLSGEAAARVHVQDAAIRAANAHRASVERALAIEVGAAARTAAASIIAHDATAVALDLARSELALAAAAYRASPGGGISVKLARDLYDQAVIDEIAARYAQVQAQATLDVELFP
jgi:outer membrane protein TolC